MNCYIKEVKQNECIREHNEQEVVYGIMIIGCLFIFLVIVFGAADHDSRH